MDDREYLILSATEKDRPGLVAELTGFLGARGCNVEDSRVVVLGGYAGLMFLLSGARDRVRAVIDELPELERTTGLRAVARRIEDMTGSIAPRHAAPAAFRVIASAMDHEGLVHAITDTVRAHGGNILELETSIDSAPMSGSPLFALRMTITVAERHGSAERLAEALEALAKAEAMDLEMFPIDIRHREVVAGRA